MIRFISIFNALNKSRKAPSFPDNFRLNSND